jgi:hypothetical protein
VLVPPGEPVRLRQTIPSAPVWVADAQGRETPGVVDLPEGWYCLPDTRSGSPAKPSAAPPTAPAPTAEGRFVPRKN